VFTKVDKVLHRVETLLERVSGTCRMPTPRRTGLLYRVSLAPPANRGIAAGWSGDSPARHHF
jgi:hypothetical protein